MYCAAVGCQPGKSQILQRFQEAPAVGSDRCWATCSGWSPSLRFSAQLRPDRAAHYHPEKSSLMQEYYELLRATSRTFAVGIEALPAPLRDAVTLAYLVLRVADYFEDSPTLADDQKRSALDRWARLVERAGDTVDEKELAPLTHAVVPQDRDLPDQAAALKAPLILDGLSRLPAHLREPIQSHTASTTRGMSRWAKCGADFPDEPALDDYMFEVAGRVGLLLTDLFCAYSPIVRKRHDRLLESAVSFGLGLQTVNIIRGLHQDPGRGWNYVPRHILPPRFTRGQPPPRLTRPGKRLAARDPELLRGQGGRPHRGSAPLLPGTPTQGARNPSLLYHPGSPRASNRRREPRKRANLQRAGQDEPGGCSPHRPIGPTSILFQCLAREGEAAGIAAHPQPDRCSPAISRPKRVR